MQDDVWNHKEFHGFHVNISQKISKLFEDLWNDKNIPKEYKLEIVNPVWRAYGGEDTEYGQIIRLPWFNVAILNGSIISLNQLDDILDATKIANEELAKVVDDIREEFEKNPPIDTCGCGPIITYHKDASQKLIKMAKPTEEDCKK